MRNQIEMQRGEDPYKGQLDKIILYSKNHNVASDELSVAYKIALGFKPEEAAKEQKISEEVYALAKDLDNLMHDGLPANRIVELIKSKSDYEYAGDNYHFLVDAMQTGEKEKRLLHSIVDRKRVGTITIMDPKNFNEFAKIEIPKEYEDDKFSSNDLASMLIKTLEKYRDKKVGISFSEL
jgi:hypothetical protein